MSALGRRGRSLGALALLTALLPANLALTGASLALGRPQRPARPTRRRTVLISGGKMTKALTLARAFAADGHRVVLVESAAYRWTGHRFSRAVDAFHVVPHPDDPGYVDAMVAVVEREGVDLYVPVCSPASSVPDGRLADRLRGGPCEVLHPGEEEVRSIDDKARFVDLARHVGVPVPRSHRVTSPEQVATFDFAAFPGPYVLKSIAYDPVRRLDLTQVPLATPEATRAHAESLPISEENPWVMQEFLDGPEFCTHTVLRGGKVVAHCCCASSAVQLNYAAVPLPAVDEWVARFAEAFPASGQLSFDFILGADGHPRAIECNPRTHSAVTTFHDHPGLAAAYLGETDGPIAPVPGSRPTFWLYEELWRLVARPGRRRTLSRLARGTDAIFDRRDPLPFLLVHHLQLPTLLLRALWRGTDWHHIDVNIGKLVEPSGD